MTMVPSQAILHNKYLSIFFCEAYISNFCLSSLAQSLLVSWFCQLCVILVNVSGLRGKTDDEINNQSVSVNIVYCRGPLTCLKLSLNTRSLGDHENLEIVYMTPLTPQEGGQGPLGLNQCSSP